MIELALGKKKEDSEGAFQDEVTAAEGVMDALGESELLDKLAEPSEHSIPNETK